MKRLLPLLCCMLMLPLYVAGQGFYNHQWLIGYWPPPYQCGRLEFDSSSYSYSQEVRKMGFWGTQGNICDAQGNFLMSSNGVWIANANNDTMLNGSGLNPGYFVNSWPNGLLITNGNLFIPTPGDTSGYTLFHQTEVNSTSTNCNLSYSQINRALDGGLGGVISKNNLIIDDSLTWGITACKHANGRDWWIIALKDSSDSVKISLFTPYGIGPALGYSLHFNPRIYKVVSQVCFSQTGNLFAFHTYDNAINRNSSIILADFDRCLGTFTNTRSVQITSGSYLWGITFSPTCQFLYTNNSNYIFQINISTFTVDTVAIYDGFSYPIPAAATTFMHEYLAANGKIYLTTGNGTQHLHEINYPDSAGIACDVQQHAINLGVWNFRSVPNHPNYNLGPVVGSVCDTLGVGIPELTHDFRFSIAPNPVSDGWIKITYLLPQNEPGALEVYSLTGQKVYSQALPPWSTLQFVHLPNLEAGIYTAVIMSGRERSAKKLVVMK